MRGGCSPLYRGMVVELCGSAPCTQLKCDVLPMKIVEVAKLKCLNYIVRTFGVRNLLPVLLEQGKDAYMARIRRGFLRNWKVGGRLGGNHQCFAADDVFLPTMLCCRRCFAADDV